MKKKVLSKDEALHLAKLAKLTLTEREIKKYQGQLGETLDYVKNLQEIKTEDVASDFYAKGAKNVFFEDKLSRERVLSQKEVFANTKQRKGNYFAVKRIL